MKQWLCFLAAGLVLVLSSCIGIQTDIRMRGDGSGVLTLSYTVSQYIKNIDAGRSQRQLPLPVNEEEFRRVAGGIEGLRLLGLEQREDEDNVYIEAELEFDSVEALNALSGGNDFGITLERQGDGTAFRQLIYAGDEGEEISAQSMEMVETFFDGYQLVYTLTAPDPVRRHSLGTLGQDGRTVTYTATVPEILESANPIVLEVFW